MPISPPRSSIIISLYACMMNPYELNFGTYMPHAPYHQLVALRSSYRLSAGRRRGSSSCTDGGELEINISQSCMHVARASDPSLIPCLECMVRRRLNRSIDTHQSLAAARARALKPVSRPYARRYRIVANSRAPLTRTDSCGSGLHGGADRSTRTRWSGPAQRDARMQHRSACRSGAHRPANCMRESFAEHVRCTT
jgi:hypothetical protein